MTDFMEWKIALIIYSVFIPAALICMIPVRKYLRWNISFKKYMMYTLGVLIAVIIFLCHFHLHKSTYYQMVFYFFMILCGCYFLYSFRLRKPVLIYIFTFVVCIFSFATLGSYYWDAYRYPTSNYTTLTIESGLSQWVGIIVITILYFLIFEKKLEWMIDHFRENRVWLFMSTPSIVISVCAVLMVPRDFQNMYVGRLFFGSVIVMITLLFLFFLIHLIFYGLCKSAYEKSEAEQMGQLLEMQLRQLDVENNYNNETHRMQHDLKHNVIALNGLLQNGRIEEAKGYLKAYSDRLDSSTMYIDYCSQPALNALLNEYVQEAEKASIHFHHHINLPDELGIDEPTLCVLVGNLLSNAIEACKKVPEETRFIKFLFDMEGSSQLYLLVQNSYDGKISFENGIPNTLPKGHYGLQSVQAVAMAYNGVARFSSNAKKFRAEIMLTMPEKSTGQK